MVSFKDLKFSTHSTCYITVIFCLLTIIVALHFIKVPINKLYKNKTEGFESVGEQYATVSQHSIPLWKYFYYFNPLYTFKPCVYGVDGVTYCDVDASLIHGRHAPVVIKKEDKKEEKVVTEEKEKHITKEKKDDCKKDEKKIESISSGSGCKKSKPRKGCGNCYKQCNCGPNHDCNISKEPVAFNKGTEDFAVI